MPTRDGKLGVGVSGVGWCASQHIAAFQRNPHTVVTALHGRDEARVRANLTKYGVSLTEVRVTTSYDDLLASPDVDIVSITTPNQFHADQAVRAAQAGKHLVLEKPTGLDAGELVRIRDAVRQAGVRTIVSFELRYHPYLQFATWLRTSGWLGEIRFARVQYLSRVTDWYSGWDWVRTREGGRSHLLAAGCHAVDALRWCSGREPERVSAFHTHFTAGYEWPTSIAVNLVLDNGALGHVTSSTDFMMPYAFPIELMGDRATLRHDLIQWLDTPVDPAGLADVNPIAAVRLEPATDSGGRPAIRIRTEMPGSADVSHHPFQAEMDELVACILEGRDTSIDVFEAQKTMEICLAADRSAALGGQPVSLPLIA
ncbi:MAG: Gfo/Idh/MocA family oxidoreductase [Acidobacteria bacterium]|nr:Gfo/Idh/MocA family oxidoreductase [Acidobacteriota bacterium]